MYDRMTNPLDAYRDTDGKLTSYAWPGGYPVFYLAADSEPICPACANGQNGSRCAETLDPDDSSDDQWRLIAADVNWEDVELYCAHCNARIPSAYAEPD